MPPAVKTSIKTIPSPKTAAGKPKAFRGAEQRFQQARRASILLKHVSDPTRLQVILILSEGERHVGALCAQLSQSQPAVSHHLALLQTWRNHCPSPPGQEQLLQLDRNGRRPGKCRQESHRLITCRGEYYSIDGHQGCSIAGTAGKEACLPAGTRTDSLSSLRQDSLANHGVERQHATAVPHQRVEIRLRVFVVSPLRIKISHLGHFTFVEQSLMRLDRSARGAENFIVELLSDHAAHPVFVPCLLDFADDPSLQAG